MMVFMCKYMREYTIEPFFDSKKCWCAFFWVRCLRFPTFIFLNNCTTGADMNWMMTIIFFYFICLLCSQISISFIFSVIANIVTNILPYLIFFFFVFFWWTLILSFSFIIGCSFICCSFEFWYFKNYIQPKWIISLLLWLWNCTQIFMVLFHFKQPTNKHILQLYWTIFFFFFSHTQKSVYVFSFSASAWNFNRFVGKCERSRDK